MSDTLMASRPFRLWQAGYAGVFAALALSACLQQTATPAIGETSAAPTRTPEPTDESTVTLDWQLNVGPGPFDLASPMVGLDKLSSYRSTLVLSFEGTRDGQPEKWSKTTSMFVVQEPAGRQLTVSTTGQPEDGTLAPLPLTEVGGIQYAGGGDAQCGASVVGTDTLSLIESEPAIFLPSVFGAEAAGSEAVNGVATDHYTFDQQALALGDGALYSGELWVASDGGYLVRYVLESKAGAEVYGEGVEGTMTWEYDLTEVNKPAAIEVPKGCPPGMVDAPLMPGAVKVLQVVGLTSYELPSGSIDDVLAFYQDKLTAQGWATGSAPIVEPDKMGSVHFTKGDLTISVIVSIADGVTQVRLILWS